MGFFRLRLLNDKCFYFCIKKAVLYEVKTVSGKCQQQEPTQDYFSRYLKNIISCVTVGMLAIMKTQKSIRYDDVMFLV